MASIRRQRPSYPSTGGIEVPPGRALLPDRGVKRQAERRDNLVLGNHRGTNEDERNGPAPVDGAGQMKRGRALVCAVRKKAIEAGNAGVNDVSHSSTPCNRPHCESCAGGLPSGRVDRRSSAWKSTRHAGYRREDAGSNPDRRRHVKDVMRGAELGAGRAHNPLKVGSTPTPATNLKEAIDADVRRINGPDRRGRLPRSAFASPRGARAPHPAHLRRRRRGHREGRINRDAPKPAITQPCLGSGFRRRLPTPGDLGPCAGRSLEKVRAWAGRANDEVPERVAARRLPASGIPRASRGGWTGSPMPRTGGFDFRTRSHPRGAA